MHPDYELDVKKTQNKLYGQIPRKNDYINNYLLSQDVI